MQKTFSIRQYRFGRLILLWIFCLCVMACNTVVAESRQDILLQSEFYSDTKHGWFWYENPPMETVEEKRPSASSSEKPSSTPNLDAYSIDELWNMYPDDFQELLNVLQKKAVQNPSEQNILEYLTMQDIARRKALAYTNATMYVTQKHGELFDVNHVYPTTGPGISARFNIQQNEIFQTLHNAQSDHALIFFVKTGCSFCEKQAGILNYFIDKYGWQIKTVDTSKNIDSATRFNITLTPTLLLIKKGQDDYMTVASGVVALTELERKLFRAIRLLQGNSKQDSFLMYDYQKGSAFDPTSILHKGDQPWKGTD